MDVHKGGGQSHVDRGGGQKPNFLVDIINDDPLEADLVKIETISEPEEIVLIGDMFLWPIDTELRTKCSLHNHVLSAHFGCIA